MPFTISHGGLTIRSKTRIVRCCHCSGMLRVSARALSIACPHCQKRVALEDLRILGSHPGKTLATCGDIVVEERAHLNLDVYGDNIVVHGRIRGSVTASTTIEICPTGRVVGDLKAPQIIVRNGAIIEGNCQMTGFPSIGKEDAQTAPQDDETGTENAESGQPNGELAEEPASPAFQPRPLRPPPGHVAPLTIEAVDSSDKGESD